MNDGMRAACLSECTDQRDRRNTKDNADMEHNIYWPVLRMTCPSQCGPPALRTFTHE